MAKAKYDYDNDNGENPFYNTIARLAAQGCTEAEIATALTLTEATFCNMKNGTYAMWSDEENKRRSDLIKQVLTRGRQSILTVIRGKYLKAALGGIKYKNVSKKFIEEACECRGSDPDCEICGGLGKITRSDKWITIETENETCPNMVALSNLLYHWDAQWREIQRGKDKDASEIVDVKQGIDIEKWINGELSGAQTGNDDTNS